LAVCIYVNLAKNIFFYYPFIAATLPFSLGSLIFFLFHQGKYQNQYFKSNIILFGLLVLFVINLIIFKFIILIDRRYSFYISLFLSTLIVAYISKYKKKFVSTRFITVDSFFGNLAYPFYLTHHGVAILVIYFFFESKRPEYQFVSFENILFLSLSFIFTNLISIFFVFFIDSKIQRVRKIVKMK
jgi:peptidoglycan/LPS O-acetylase OafA/YrhL